MARITQETVAQMIDVHKRVDPYSPYGTHKASFEANAERATHPAAKRAEWLNAAAHWRGVMQTRLILGERAQAFRAYKFARIAASAAHYA